MENAPRKRRIVDVQRPRTQPPPPPPIPRFDVDDSQFPSIPLELSPAVRAMIGYGKRMNGLGALRGVRAMERLLEELSAYARFSPELSEFVSRHSSTAAGLRAEAVRLASGGEEDD